MAAAVVLARLPVGPQVVEVAMEQLAEGDQEEEEEQQEDREVAAAAVVDQEVLELGLEPELVKARSTPSFAGSIWLEGVHMVRCTGAFTTLRVPSSPSRLSISTHPTTM